MTEIDKRRSQEAEENPISTNEETRRQRRTDIGEAKRMKKIEKKKSGDWGAKPQLGFQERTRTTTGEAKAQGDGESQQPNRDRRKKKPTASEDQNRREKPKADNEHKQ